jgi:hypothetical protein
LEGFGHAGGTGLFFSLMTVVPKLDLGIFVATNTTGGTAMTQRVTGQILEHFYGVPTKSERGDPGLLRSASRFEGRYLDTRRAFYGLERFVDLLSSSSTVFVTADGYLVTQVGGYIRTWVPDDAPMRFRSVQGDDRLTFRLGADGRPDGYWGWTGNLMMERAPIWTSRQLLLGLALLAVIGAVGGIVGAFRGIRKSPATAWQTGLRRMFAVTSGLWLVTLAALAIWIETSQSLGLGAPFPDRLLRFTSGAGLLASLGSAICLLGLPLAWRGGRTDGWTLARKSHVTATVLVFLALAGLLTYWGALDVWS